MAKLSLSFKGRPIAVHHFDDDSEVATIGRDPSCSLVIDSLAVAPLHAKIVCDQNNNFKVIAPANDVPVLVNHHVIAEQSLSHGDIIQIGKHTLAFAKDDQIFDLPPSHHAASHIVKLPTAAPAPHEQPNLDGISSDDLAAVDQQSQLKTCIQIVNGKHFGKVIPIDGGLTRLGIEGLATAAIAHRKEGYFLAHLEGSKRPRVNGSSIEEHSQQLFEGDNIQIGNIRMVFHHKDTIIQSDIAADA